MQTLQFPQLELVFLFDSITPLIKRNKILSLFIYFLSVTYLSIPSFHIPFLEYSGFHVTSLMEQRAMENQLYFYPHQSWVSIDDVHPYLLKSIITMEDGKFFTHKGIDWQELKTSLSLNKRRGRAVRGGSTITMQLAKNLFLTTDKSILRKAKEFIITFRMEKELTKKSILENYINAVEWGDGIFGIKKASNIYFDKEPSSLNLNEAARLAAVIPSPLRYKPNGNSNYVLRRTSIIKGRINDVILFPKK